MQVRAARRAGGCAGGSARSQAGACEEVRRRNSRLSAGARQKGGGQGARGQENDRQEVRGSQEEVEGGLVPREHVNGQPWPSLIRFRGVFDCLPPRRYGMLASTFVGLTDLHEPGSFGGQDNYFRARGHGYVLRVSCNVYRVVCCVLSSDVLWCCSLYTLMPASERPLRPTSPYPMVGSGLAVNREARAALRAGPIKV